MEKELLRPLFDRGLCQSCMMVSEGWDPATTADTACPSCGESGFGLEWPPEPAGLLIRQAFAPLGGSGGQAGTPDEPAFGVDYGAGQQVEESPEYETPEPFGDGNAFEDRKDGRELEEAEQAAVRGFLVVTALDVTLEWIFKAAMESLDTDSVEVARLVEPRHEATLTTEQRLDMLHELKGLDLADLARDQDEPHFVGWWQRLRVKRFGFVHAHSMNAFDDVTEEGLFDLARMGVKVLAAANNQLW